MDQAIGLRELMKEHKKTRSKLRVIGVTSGKGGVGKSNVAANLAVLASRAGNRVLVLDADLGLANVEVLFGLKPRYHLGHLLDGDVPVRDIIAEGPEGVMVLPAGHGLQALTRLDEAQRLRLVAAVDQLEEDYDIIFVDCGAGIGDNVLFFVGAAQEALLVVSPEPTSLTDAYATLKVLCQEGRARYFNVVVNQAPNEAVAKDIFDRLSSVVSRFLGAKMRWLGWLPRDENVHRAVMSQKPLVGLFPSSPATRALNSVADTLFNEPPPIQLEGGLKFLWSRLLRESSVH